MPAVREAIDKMSTSEKFQTMDYLWQSLSSEGEALSPAWHQRELAETEARVACGQERPIPWEAAKSTAFWLLSRIGQQIPPEHLLQDRRRPCHRLESIGPTV